MPAYSGVMLWVAAVVALCIDQWIGEPPPRWHPVVWMGHYLAWAGAWLQRQVRSTPSPCPSPALGGGALTASPSTNAGDCAANLSVGPDRPSFWRGAAVWLLGAIAVVLPACLLQWLIWQLPWGWAALLTGVLLKPLLAWRMLSDEVVAVEQQLGQSLAQGQQQLARIVSRDVTVLDATQVRESALESLAENLNDSVIAPLCWFALLGLPGAALYRFADTADSMWGYRGMYRGQCWEWAGKWAARADDALAWLPARITGIALLLAGAAGKLRQWPREAAQTPSPNSGWPMAALALALGVRLRKPGVYVLHAQGHAAQAQHIAQAVRLAAWAVLGLVAAWGGGWLLVLATRGWLAGAIA